MTVEPFDPGDLIDITDQWIVASILHSSADEAKRKREEDLDWLRALGCADFNPLAMEDVAAEQDRKRRRELEIAEERTKELQQRQSILSQTQDGGFKAFLEWTFTKDDRNKTANDEQRALLQTLNDKTDKTDKAVSELAAKTERTDKAVSEAVDRIAALEEKMRQGPPSNASSSTRAGSSHFAATFVEAYGWVEDWTNAETRSKTTLSDRNAAQLISNMLAVLDSKDSLLKAKVDELGTLRLQGSRPSYASVRVKFVAGTEGDDLWAAKKIWENAWNDAAQKPKMILDITVPPQRVKFRVESAPWKAPHLQAIGRFHGVWSKNVTTRLIQIKGMAGGGRTPSEMWTDPDEQGNRKQLGEFTAGGEYGGTGQWRIFKNAWDNFATHHQISISAEAMEAALATRNPR